MIKWSPEEIVAFRQCLLDWYDKDGRQHLPWRSSQTAYHVWVSEIMLQQTQVETVIPYYNRFIQTLPDIWSLASAPEDQLLKLWEGLGYYSRVRNMQKAAQILVKDYQGLFPETSKALQALPGIGPYTAAAIASIAFGEVVPALDGNMFRVFARLLEIDADIALPKTRQLFYEIILPIVDPERPGDFNQAIMDIGSRFMTAKNYDHDHNPLRSFDASYQHGTTAHYPVKSKKIKQKERYFAALISKDSKGRLAYEKRSDKGLLAQFWTYPLLECGNWDSIFPNVRDSYGDLSKQLTIKPISHVFTHQKWHMMLVDIGQVPKDKDWQWLSRQDFSEQAQTTLMTKLQAAYLAER